MEAKTQRLKELQRQLTSDSEVCCSGEALDTFPEAFKMSFLVEHVGIIVCHRGKFTIRAGNELHEVCEGYTVFINRGTYLHVTETSSDCLYSLLFYRVDSIRDILGNTIMGMKFWEVIHPTTCRIIANEETGDILHYIALFASLGDYTKDVFIEKERMLLMLSLTYKLCSIFSKTMSSSASLSARQTDIYIKFINLTGKYYDSERGVAFYADKLCISPKYLSAIVKQISGITAQQHIFKAIIRRSIFLMNNTDKSVKEISDSLHFANPSAFGTFFKKHTGASPRLFRNGFRRS